MGWDLWDWHYVNYSIAQQHASYPVAEAVSFIVCLLGLLHACLQPRGMRARHLLLYRYLYPRTEGLTVCICGSHCVPQCKCLTVFLSLCATVQVSHCAPLTVCVYEQLQLTASWVESAGTSFSPTFL